MLLLWYLICISYITTFQSISQLLLYKTVKYVGKKPTHTTFTVKGKIGLSYQLIPRNKLMAMLN